MKKLITFLFLLASITLFAQTAQKQTLVVVDGNSIPSNLGTHVESRGFCDHLQRLLGCKYKVVSVGVGGQGTSTMITNYSANVGSLYSASTYRSCILIAWEERNSLVVDSKTTTAAYNDIVTYAGLGRATGYKVIVMDILPSWAAVYKGDNTVTGYNLLDTERLAVNALIAADNTNFDAKIAIGSNPFMGTQGQNAQAGYSYSNVTRPTRIAYYDDGTHLSENGALIAAGEACQRILKMN